MMSAGFCGWDGRIRTYGTLYQKQLPYHLATSQRALVDRTGLRGVQALSVINLLNFALFLICVYTQQIGMLFSAFLIDDAAELFVLSCIDILHRCGL